MDFPGGTVVKNPSANAEDTRDARFKPWVGKIPRAVHDCVGTFTHTHTHTHTFTHTHI